MVEEDVKKSFLQGDPVIRFVSLKLKLPYWALPLFMIVWALILFFGYASIIGVVYTKNDPTVLGTLNHPGELIIAFFVQPVIVGYYLSMNKILWNALKGLSDKGVIPRTEYKNFLSELGRISKNINGKSVLFLGIVIALIISTLIILVAFNLKEGPFWLHKNRWIFMLFEMPRTFATSYAIAMIGLRVLLFQYHLSRLYEVIPTELHPLHEDGAGGYASIGNSIGSYFIWIFAGFGFYLASGITYLSNSATKEIPDYMWIQFISLPIVVIVVFFWTLWSTHREMENALCRKLARFSKKYDDLELLITSQKNSISEEQMKYLDQLLEITQKIKRTAPTWPFNTLVLNGFFAYLGASILPLALSILEKYLSPQ